MQSDEQELERLQPIADELNTSPGRLIVLLHVVQQAGEGLARWSDDELDQFWAWVDKDPTKFGTTRETLRHLASYYKDRDTPDAHILALDGDRSRLTDYGRYAIRRLLRPRGS